MVFKVLEELTRSEFRRELRKRDLSDKGKIPELFDRLRMALEKDGLDPEDHEFEFCDEVLMNKLDSMIARFERMGAARVESMATQNEIKETSKKFDENQEKSEELIFEGHLCSREVEARTDDHEDSIEKSVEFRMKNLERGVEKDVGDHVDDLENSVKSKVEDLENSVDTKVEDLVSGMETRSRNTIERVLTGCRVEEEVQLVESTEAPVFNDAVSWSVCNFQLEIAAKSSDLLSSQQRVEDLIFSTEDALQPLGYDPGREDPDKIEGPLELGFGCQHAPDVFRAQLKSCRLMPHDGSQQLWASVEWPADLACSMGFRDGLGGIVARGFVAALESSGTRRVLGVARVVGPSGALTFTLNYEELLVKSYRVRKKRETS